MMKSVNCLVLFVSDSGDVVVRGCSAVLFFFFFADLLELYVPCEIYE